MALGSGRNKTHHYYVTYKRFCLGGGEWDEVQVLGKFLPLLPLYVVT